MMVINPYIYGIPSCYYTLSTNKYLEFGTGLSVFFTGVGKTFTTTFLLKRTAIDTIQNIFSIWNGQGDQRAIMVRFNASNAIEVIFSVLGTTTLARNTTAQFTNTTDYYMITVKADMSSLDWSGVKVNINGIDSPFSTPTGALSSTIFSSSAIFRIGAIKDAAGVLVQFAEFNINDAAIYDEVVSDADLLARYNGGDILPANTIAGLVFEADFIEDTWDGSNWDIIDNVGANDGVSVNVLEEDKICVNV